MKLAIVLVLLNIALIGAKLLDESFKEKPDQLDELAFIQNDDIIESEENYIRSQLASLSPRNKRFLSSVLDIFKPKDKEKEDSKGGNDLFGKFDTVLCKYTNTCIGNIIKGSGQTTKLASSDVESDPFYKLKQVCDRHYDDFCRNKKREMRELVKKCEAFDSRSQPESCKEIISIYCYIFMTHDIFRCFANDYQMYKPGIKKYTTAHPTVYTSKASTFSTYSTRSPSTYKPATISSTTRSTTQPMVYSTSKSTTTYGSSSSVRPAATSSSGLVNPFGNEPFTTIPNDSDKLKKIGTYCQSIKTKEANCDKALTMLRDKFKKCEKSPKTDQECQSFKMNLCSAFPKFTCCSDILAGRNCAGSKTRRSILFM